MTPASDISTTPSAAAPPSEVEPRGILRVLVVAQTPPPHGGQALMVEHLVRATFERIRVDHIRLAFSDSMASMGRAEAGKVLHLVAVLGRLVAHRIRGRSDLVLYCPAGPHAVPVLRDIVLLAAIRLLHPRTVLHFHAAGLSGFLEACHPLLRRAATLAYGQPHGAIQTSRLNPPDGAFLRARRVAVIPNGLPDEAADLTRPVARRHDGVRLLYVGRVDESKGVFVLLESLAALQDRGHDVTLQVVGQYGSSAFADRVRNYCADRELTDAVDLPGPLVGQEKWNSFRQADVFCYPTFFESESFGNVAVEAMMFGLPVVASRWRGVPDVVRHGETGLLVPPRDAAALADALERLVADPTLRKSMGEAGRARYCERFTLARHLGDVERFLHEVASA